MIIGGIFPVSNALNPHKAITQYKLDTWTPEQGLPLNVIFAIIQSRDGYLYLGTREGLVRFDGSRFVVFNKSNTKKLKCNVVRALCLDRAGRLWVGTLEGGLSCLQDGKWTTYGVEENPALTGIIAICEARDGSLWIGTINNGLTHMNNGLFTTYGTEDSLISSGVRALLYDQKDNLWVGTTAGLAKLNPSGKFTGYGDAAGLPGDLIYYLYEKKNGEIRISHVAGLFRVRKDQIVPIKIRGELPNPKIIYMLEDSERNFWAGADGGGLSRIKEDGQVETLSIENGLKCGNIFSICEDREGSLWLGTLTGGLHRLRETMFTMVTTKEGLPHNNIYCIYEDRDGSTWIGTHSGLCRHKNGQWALEFSTRQGLLSNQVYALLEDGSGGLWIGTRRGLHLYKNGKLRTFTTEHGLSDNRVFTLLEGRQGTVWIGTLNGLNRYDKGEFTVFKGEGGLLHHTVIGLLEDRRGNLWIITLNGLNKLSSGKFTAYTTAEGLVDNSVECFYEDKRGVIYIGTRGGLSRLQDGRFYNYTSRSGLITSRVSYILEDDRKNLYLAGPSGISRVAKKDFEDFDAGRIAAVRPVTYNEQDGMKTRWIKSSGMKSRDGRLWFATDKGAVFIDPAAIKLNNLPPPVVIEALIVDGKPLKINRSKGPVMIPAGSKRVEINYTGLSFIKPGKMKFKSKLTGYDSGWIDPGSQRNTTYTGLSPGPYTFAVTACNADGVWNEQGASLSFYLKPHWYQTWWSYIIFGISFLFGVACFVRWRSLKHVKEKQRLERIIKDRTKEIEAKNIQLQEQSEKLQEMDKIKSRFFANISHEFRTPLTLIMGPLEQMLDESSNKEQQQKLDLMLRNSRRLLGLISQLLDLSKFESGLMKLRAARQDIVSFSKGMVKSFESLTEQNELELNINSDVEDFEIYFDAEKLEKVFSNLLINAVKFTPPGGKITVTLTAPPTPPLRGTPPKEGNSEHFVFSSLKVPPDHSPLERGGPPQAGRGVSKSPKKNKAFAHRNITISIRDTGIGIPADQAEHIFDRFYQAERLGEHTHKGTGIGLALTKELVNLHRGEIRVHSEEGKGSEFIIKLPVGDAHLQPHMRGEALSASRNVSHRDGPEPHMRGEAFSRFAAHREKSVASALNGSPSSGAGRRSQEEDLILIVEDNADVRAYIRGALTHHYKVALAKDGEEGIKKAREIIPDLIISDVMMPGIDGYELCRTLKKDVLTSHVPIILLTAKADEENIIKGLGTGADDYVTKPFSTKILLARIKNLIDIRGQLQENLRREMTLQPVKTTMSTVDREFLQELQRILEDNIADPDFNVDQLCKKLYMSHTTLYRKIQALSGESPTDFLRSYRLKKGAELLKNNFGNVLEVALEVGFSTANYFTRCFKKKFHQLPSEYQAE